MTWDEVVAAGLALPGAELSTSYGQPALKVKGRTFASVGSVAGSFVLHLPLDAVAMLVEAEPDSFHQTPHYQGWPAVLLRHTAPAALTRFWLERAHAEQAAKRKR